MVISSSSGRWPRGQASRGWYRGCARSTINKAFVLFICSFPPSLISLLVESSWVQSHRGERPFHQVGPILFCFCSSQDLVVFHLNYAPCISGWRAHNLWRSLSYKTTLSWEKQFYVRTVRLPGMVMCVYMYVWVSIVCMWMDVCIYVCIHVCMCAIVCFVYIGLYEHVYICMCLHMGVCLYAYVCTCVHAPVYVSLYASFTYLCMHVCMCVCICVDKGAGIGNLLIGHYHWGNQRLHICTECFYISICLKYH